MTTLTTDRLTLRPWQNSDRPPFAVMSADTESMQYLGSVWDQATADNFIDRMNKHHQDYGYGPMAIELKDSGEFIGFCGLKNVTFQSFFTPAIEIGWRIARPHWNQGYATEAARRIIDYGFSELKLPQIISYVTPANGASTKVMEKLGMIKEQSFIHPSMNKEDLFSKMILFRLKNFI